MNLPHDANIVNDGAQHQWSPEVHLLIDWFEANKNNLPATPFALSSYEKVTNAIAFYTRIEKDIAAAPNKVSGWQLLNKLKKLQVMVER